MYHVDIVDITTDNRLPGLQPRDCDDGLLLQLLLPGLLRHGGAGPPAAGILASIRGLGTNHIRFSYILHCSRIFVKSNAPVHSDYQLPFSAACFWKEMGKLYKFAV